METESQRLKLSSPSEGVRRACVKAAQMVCLSSGVHSNRTLGSKSMSLEKFVRSNFCPESQREAASTSPTSSCTNAVSK